MVLYQIIKGACEDRKEVQGPNPGHSQQLEMRKMRKTTAKETKKEKRGGRKYASNNNKCGMRARRRKAPL